MRGLTHVAAAIAAACVCMTAAGCATTSSPTASDAAAEPTPIAQAATAGMSQATASTVTATSASTRASASAPRSAVPEGYDPSRNASTDIAAALKLAKTDHKKVLLDFGADWCPDCRVLGKTFQNPAVGSVLTKDYHVVAVDVGSFDHNLDVAGHYIKLQTSGIPGLVVLKPDGTVSVATNDGSFSNARTMTANQVLDFLNHWSS